MLVSKCSRSKKLFSIGFRLFYTFEVVFLVQLDAGFSTCLKLLRFDNVRLLRLF